MPFHWPRAHHVTCKWLPTNNGLLMRNVIQLEIIFFSCVNETTLFTFLRENSTSLRFPKIFIKKKPRRSNDKTTIELGYRLSFVSVSVNNWSARHWQITIFCSTLSSAPPPTVQQSFIHSKYFSFSDWLKSPGWFFITS